MGGPADYGPNSICRSGWISFEDGHVGKVTPPIIVRNLNLFGMFHQFLDQSTVFREEIRGCPVEEFFLKE